MMKSKIIFSLILMVFVFMFSACTFKLSEEHPQVTKGQVLFEKYCVECHGKDGKGIESLRKAYDHVDLTRINLRRDLDEFPVDEIARYIDGREHYKEFGPRPMPMWGVDMMARENEYNPDSSRTNLGAIISYLITIQK